MLLQYHKAPVYKTGYKRVCPADHCCTVLVAERVNVKYYFFVLISQEEEPRICSTQAEKCMKAISP